VTGGPILAIDTSSNTASVAVYADQVLAETTWHSGRRHSAELLPAINETLARAHVEKRSLAALAVAIGPGSYSGLRVGVSTAMAMGLALNLPLVQVPTLDIIAWGQGASRPVRAAVDVGRGHYATARFHCVDSHLEPETRIESVGLSQLVELAAVERSLLAVDLDPDTRETIEHQHGARIELTSPAASARRAGFLAELAAIKIQRGELVGDLAVEPIYLHS
jgi:tRNA threonylcarbamoyladenosine biosynthesis protein TsaB